MKINGKQFANLDLVQIAKRDNNKKRPYLLVNPCQGKHVPVSPFTALASFQNLTEQVERYVEKEDTVLMIAFAETATAIGSGIACGLKKDIYYIQTTRENIDGAEYLYFSESHSHATEQRIVRNDLAEVLDKADKIIFAEDEVTTGNTICNLINQIENYYPKKSRCYGIVSILNGMSSEAEQDFLKKGIRLMYLLKTDNETYGEQIEQFKYDGEQKEKCFEYSPQNITYHTIGNYINPRKMTSNRKYEKSCNALGERIIELIDLQENSDILVLGTEEFMYPALLAAEKLEKMKQVRSVRFHATTRSPILTSKQAGYPLQTRFELASLYDENRKTFIYNLKKYDQVIIVTDTPTAEKNGLKTLLSALESVGNRNISVFEWRN